MIRPASIYTAILSFALGVAFETFSNASIYLLVFILLLGLAIAAEVGVSLLRNASALMRQSTGAAGSVLARKHPLLPPVICSLIFFSLGAIRFQTYKKTADPILSDTRGKVEITGIISEDPDVRQDKQLLTLRVGSIGGDKVAGENKILIQSGLFPAHAYGDELSVYGILLPPRNFSDDETGETFDYVSYLQKDRIYFVMYRPQMSVIAKNKGNPILATLLSIKHMFIDSVGRNISEPNASFISAVIVGERHSVPEDILNMLRAVGIIHIVILSGYAITIIAELVRRFFSRFGFRTSLVLASISIVLFALMTGASAMVVRASIMALFAFLSRAFSRKHDVVRALALTLFLMVLWNPMILVFDVSFQVSMLAVLGLVFISPVFEKRYKNEIVVSTLSAQIAVLPYLLYVTGSLSLFSVPANLLVLPLLPMTMLFGLLSGAIGLVSSFLALPFSAVAYVLTSYELAVAKIFSAIPFSSVAIPMPFWIVVIIYAGLVFYLVRFHRRNRLTEKGIGVISTQKHI